MTYQLDSADVQTGGQPGDDSAAPSDAGRTDGRDERGRFTVGHPGPAFKGGAHSARVRAEALKTVEAVAVLAERRDLIETDLGGRSELSFETRVRRQRPRSARTVRRFLITSACAVV